MWSLSVLISRARWLAEWASLPQFPPGISWWRVRFWSQRRRLEPLPWCLLKILPLCVLVSFSLKWQNDGVDSTGWFWDLSKVLYKSTWHSRVDVLCVYERRSRHELHVMIWFVRFLCILLFSLWILPRLVIHAVLCCASTALLVINVFLRYFRTRRSSEWVTA